MTPQLSLDQLLEKYGTVRVHFESYYKYTFNFTATLPTGEILWCYVGGNPDDIYRLSVSQEDSYAVEDLSPYRAEVFLFGEMVEVFSD